MHVIHSRESNHETFAGKEEDSTFQMRTIRNSKITLSPSKMESVGVISSKESISETATIIENSESFKFSALKEVSTIYFEDALWYKANSLIKLKERKSAKAILKKIISLKGKYQNSANKLLTTL